MRTKFLSAAGVAGALIAAALLAGGTASADDRLGADEVRQLRESGAILAMEDILARAHDAQPGQIVEVELEREDGRFVYEVKLIDDGDRVHELELDAGTGEVLQHERK